MAVGDQKWHPVHYPNLPSRVDRLEATMDSVEEKLERGERIMTRIQWLGWIVAAELAAMVAASVGLF